MFLGRGVMNSANVFRVADCWRSQDPEDLHGRQTCNARPAVGRFFNRSQRTRRHESNDGEGHCDEQAGKPGQKPSQGAAEPTVAVAMKVTAFP